MRKTLKIIFCSLVIVTILTANVFAGWEGYTPDFGVTETESAILYDENLRSSYSTMEFITLVDNAYELGLFGGSYPIAVTLFNDVNYNEFIPYIVCVCPYTGIMTANIVVKSSLGSIYERINNKVVGSTEELVLSLWLLFPTGDVQCIEPLMLNGHEMDTNEKLYLLRNTDKTDGINGWYWDDNDSNFAQFYSVDGNVNNGIVEINELYEMALQNYIPPTPPSDPEPDPEPIPPVVNNFTYLLDIPSIITAIPNGAKQIIDNAFGFELFGINIAGLLSVFIIIAIVAYAVKKMMSR